MFEGGGTDQHGDAAATLCARYVGFAAWGCTYVRVLRPVQICGKSRVQRLNLSCFEPAIYPAGSILKPLSCRGRLRIDEPRPCEGTETSFHTYAGVGCFCPLCRWLCSAAKSADLSILAVLSCVFFYMHILWFFILSTSARD